MSTSGLLITVEQDQAAGLAVDCLRRFPGLILGERVGGRLPAVLEAEDACAAEAACDRLRHCPGIVNLDVVFVSVEPHHISTTWEA